MRNPFDVIRRVTASGSGNYYCIGSGKECSVFEEDGAVVIPWAKRDEVIAETEALRLIPSRKSHRKELPGLVRRLKNLRFLQLPISMLGDIEIGDFSANLEALLVMSQKADLDFKAEWDGIEAADGLKFIEFQSEFGADSCGDNLIGFDINNFRLDYLGFDLSKNGNLLTGIAADNPLKTVVISDVGNFALEQYLPDGIEEIGVILSGSNFCLGGLRKYEKLTSLFLNGVRSEIDCSTFLSMPNLAELSIINSRKIANAADIIRNPFLKKISLCNCGKPFKGMLGGFDYSRYEMLDVKFA